MQESKDIDYAKQHHTPHCWLPAKVMYAANSTKRLSWLTCSTPILLMKHVHIYCSGHSTEIALLKVVDDLFLSLSKDNISVQALLDFSSAFDTIYHYSCTPSTY